MDTCPLATSILHSKSRMNASPGRQGARLPLAFPSRPCPTELFSPPPRAACRPPRPRLQGSLHFPFPHSRPAATRATTPNPLASTSYPKEHCLKQFPPLHPQVQGRLRPLRGNAGRAAEKQRAQGRGPRQGQSPHERLHHKVQVSGAVLAGGRGDSGSFPLWSLPPSKVQGLPAHSSIAYVLSVRRLPRVFLAWTELCLGGSRPPHTRTDPQPTLISSPTITTFYLQ
jgi:hypothetical protein